MSSATPLREGPGIRFGAFILLLVVARWALLLAGLDPEEDRVASYFDAAEVSWARGPDRPLYDREELYTGAAAELVRLGAPLPARAYQFMPYGGGSLVVAQLARPLFAALGPSYLTFKLLALCVTLLGGACWYGVARLWLGARGATWFAGLYLFAPTVLVRTMLIAKGDHAEATAWIGLTAWLASAAIFSASETRRRWLAGLAGLAASLGVALTYSTLPITGAVGSTLAARTRLRPGRGWLWAAAGLALGLLPWLAGALATGAGALRVYGRPLGALLPLGEALARLWLVLRTGFLASYDLPEMLRSGAGLFWLFTVLVAWVLLAMRPPRRGFRTVLLVGSLAHLLAFAAAAPDASSRYLVPAYPLLLLAVAGAAAGAERGAELALRSRRLRDLLPIPAIVLGLTAQVLVVSASGFPGLRAPLRGYDWALLGEVLGTKLTAEGVRALPEGVRPFVWVGLGRRASRQDVAFWRDEAARASAEAPFVWEGIGVGALESGRWRLAARVLPDLPERDRAALRRGLWRYGELVFAPLLARGASAAIRETVEAFEPADRAACRQALARTLAVLWIHGAPLSEPQAMDASRLLGSEERAEAAGWALCRSVSPAGIRWWRPARAGPLSAWQDGFARPAAEAAHSVEGTAFWRGAAAAWAAFLGTVEPKRILELERARQSVWRAAAAASAGLPSASAACFYRSAGSAVAAAWLDPARDPRRSRDLPDWRAHVPAEHQAAFLEGARSAGLAVGE